jgi:hypothetical protein
MRTARIIAGFLIAPLITPLVLLGVAQLKTEELDLVGLQGIFIFVAMFAYAATILFGLPVFFLFRAQRWNNMLLYILAGGLIGLLVSIILNPRLSIDVAVLESRGLCALGGASSALGFRLLSGVKFNHRSGDSPNGET